MANWSELPVELLGMIHDELSIFDYIRSKAICKQWNLVCKFEHHRPPKPQAPWLMLPGDNDSTAKFFSIVEKKVYNIPCPEPMIRRRICIGSCYGWLTTVDSLCNMYLLNPLTGAQIPLPSVTTLPFVKTVHDPQGQIVNFIVGQERNELSCWSMHALFFSKAVLSAAPDADNDFTIMMIYGLWKNLAFARAGDKAWQSISSPYWYTDIIHHNAKFYTINYQRMVEVWGLDELAIRHSVINSDLPSHILLGCICTYYLVESLHGNLMSVYKFQNEWGRTDNPKNIMCMVFSLDEQALTWTRVESLHEQTLFLGKNQSMCLSTVDFPELKQNCIYYTDDMLQLCGSHQYMNRYVGIFYLEDEMTRPIDHLGHHLNCPPPLWLTPSLS
ncbi:F-box and DUF domain containing protein [Musa troglodytarum]|uniref:F-box and DUF domain containing protein n=3 Tax=Musa troglodytarum TaxID=320322 RepID=A0A9E7KN20_9LILI|nr:F-box and DUF domain containing protein [Musa troglodytarum]